MSDPSLSVYPLGHSVNFTSSKESDKVVHGTTGEIVLQELPGVGYRLYKMRFAGLIALVAFNIVCASMSADHYLSECGRLTLLYLNSELGLVLSY